MSEKIPSNAREAGPAASHSEATNAGERAQVTTIETHGKEERAQFLKEEADKLREKHEPASLKNEGVSENTPQEKIESSGGGHHKDGLFLGSAKNTGAFFGVILLWLWQAIKRAPEMAGGGGGGGGHAKKDDHHGGGH